MEIEQLECPKTLLYDTVLGHFLYVSKRCVYGMGQNNFKLS
jgi:hypothetical protein